MLLLEAFLCSLQEENVPGVTTVRHAVSRTEELLVGHSIPALAMAQSSVFPEIACNSYSWVYVEGRIREPCCRGHQTAVKSLAKEEKGQFPRLIFQSSPGGWRLKSAKPFFDWPHVAKVITANTTGIPHHSITDYGGPA